MVDFGGWNMPVQYTGILDEHQAVRRALGVFDISHMGEVFVSGPEAKAWLNFVLANNIERLAVGEGHYTFLLNEQGGVIDDLLVYQCAPGEYLLVINASKIEQDVAWMQSQLRPGVVFEDRSDAYAGLAIQGPEAVAFFTRFCPGSEALCPARNRIVKLEFNGVPIWVARTGYTGEDGFEFFFSATEASKVWNAILTTGAQFGIKPCGLGSRDTLRLEMCYPLNGSDLSAGHTPLEAGLGFFVDLEKGEFIGRSALAAQKANGVPRKLVAFKMADKGPPLRSHYPIFKNGQQIGETSSGSLSPSLGIGIGMAYLPPEFAGVGEEIEVEIRGRRFLAAIQKKPLYKK